MFAADPAIAAPALDGATAFSPPRGRSQPLNAPLAAVHARIRPAVSQDQPCSHGFLLPGVGRGRCFRMRRFHPPRQKLQDDEEPGRRRSLRLCVGPQTGGAPVVDTARPSRGRVVRCRCQTPRLVYTARTTPLEACEVAFADGTPLSRSPLSLSSDRGSMSPPPPSHAAQSAMGASEPPADSTLRMPPTWHLSRKPHPGSARFTDRPRAPPSQAQLFVIHPRSRLHHARPCTPSCCLSGGPSWAPRGGRRRHGRRRRWLHPATTIPRLGWRRLRAHFRGTQPIWPPQQRRGLGAHSPHRQVPVASGRPGHGWPGAPPAPAARAPRLGSGGGARSFVMPACLERPSSPIQCLVRWGTCGGPVLGEFY